MSPSRGVRLARAAFWISVLALALAIVLAVMVARPYPAAHLERGAASSLIITDRHGEPLRTLPLAGGGRAVWVDLDRVPPLVVAATVAGEDHRFHEHDGVDGRAVARALYLTVTHGRVVSGASTITMQLVRAIEPHPRTLTAKLAEAVDALRLERAASKRIILEQYLNRVYYGNGAFGIEAAARLYFDKPAAALSAGEGTLLAVLPRAPRAYDPYRDLAPALARRAHVLSLMEKRGWIAADERARAEAQPLTLAPPPGRGPRRPAAPPPTAPSLAPHFVDWVLPQLSAEQRRRGGVVTTTLDLALQRRLERSVRAHLDERRRHCLAQAGALILDPATGAVRAMVGSADHAGPGAGQVNITTLPRHPGSTLKPFVYALAIEAGDHPATLARDLLEPGAGAAAAGYAPRRQMRERGHARYREALAGSFNLAAVDVLARVGVSPLLERLRAAGLGPLAGTAPDYGLDLALGSARVRLVDLTAAYGFLVMGGAAAPARALEDAPAAATPLFAPEASFLVMDMLADAGARRAAFGAELPLDLPFPIAAKTGTSSGFADTLTIAATREALVAAWAGAFDGSGTRGALAMWSAAPIVRAGLLAVRDQLGRDLTLPPPPATVTAADLCAVTGGLATPVCPRKREYLVAVRPLPGTCPDHR